MSTAPRPPGLAALVAACAARARDGAPSQTGSTALALCAAFQHGRAAQAARRRIAGTPPT